MVREKSFVFEKIRKQRSDLSLKKMFSKFKLLMNIFNPRVSLQSVKEFENVLTTQTVLNQT